MALKTYPYDSADYLDSDEAVLVYLTEMMSDNDPRLIAKALGAVARAKGGMTKLAKDTGLSREALYRALSTEGNPEFATILKVIAALGIRLQAAPKSLVETEQAVAA